MARIDSPRRSTTILSTLRDSKNPLMNRLRVVTALGILGCVGGTSQEYGPTPTTPDGVEQRADAGTTPEPEDAGAGAGDGGDGGEPPRLDGADAPDAGAAPDATQPLCANSDGDPFCDDEEVCDDAEDLVNPATGEPLNSDSDPLPNACDPCDTNPNDNGEDRDGDGLGDVCDGAPDNSDTGADGDNDGVPNIIDNCGRSNPPPVSPEPGQSPIQIDVDGDLSGPPCDCNDNNDDIHPGATDTPCDGENTDCDVAGNGRLATTYSNSTVTIVGEPTCECIPGTERTTGPSAGPCEPLQEECQLDYDADGNPFSHFVPLNEDDAVGPAPEACNDEDDDCDGTTDEDLENCECQNGDTRPCGTDVPPCVAGEQPCVNNQWSDECDGDVPPAASDPCNNVNDDCSGRIDDAYGTDPDVAACIGLRSGLPGTMRCLDSTHAVCDADSVSATEERCDGLDNNYNGNVDDANFTIVGGTAGATARPGTACSAGRGACAINTTFRCAGDFAVECPTPAPNPETCGDEVDNDCDGTTDEDCACDPTGADADAPIPCGTNTGACNEGVRECLSSGQRSATCGGLGPNGLPYSAGSPEDCNNGEDDDCDGRTDEPVGDDCITILGEDGEFVCDPTTGEALCLD